MNFDIPYHSVVMVRDDLNDLPTWQLPDGFTIRPWQSGDDQHWHRIETCAEPREKIAPDIWQREFGSQPNELHRQLFVCHGDTPVGTASAWVSAPPESPSRGRIHWVAIVPDYQGRGLATPLMGACMDLFVALGHDSAYLVTHTARIPAINLYLKFGFRPRLETPDEREIWAHLNGQLPALQPFLNDITSQDL